MVNLFHRLWDWLRSNGIWITEKSFILINQSGSCCDVVVGHGKQDENWDNHKQERLGFLVFYSVKENLAVNNMQVVFKVFVLLSVERKSKCHCVKRREHGYTVDTSAMLNAIFILHFCTLLHKHRQYTLHPTTQHSQAIKGIRMRSGKNKTKLCTITYCVNLNVQRMCTFTKPCDLSLFCAYVVVNQNYDP